MSYRLEYEMDGIRIERDKIGKRFLQVCLLIAILTTGTLCAVFGSGLFSLLLTGQRDICVGYGQVFSQFENDNGLMGAVQTFYGEFFQ